MNHPVIEAPNYTQIPNVIFDYWMEILSPGSFKILMCMCRKIFGWHKTSDTISKNQLIKVTGMSKNSVQTGIEELEKHGLVLKFQHKNEYGHQPNTFALNIEKPKDERYQEPPRPGSNQNLGGGRSEIDPGVGQNLTKGVGQNLTPQKKDLTKERLTKEEHTLANASDVGEPDSSLSVKSVKNEQKDSFGEHGNCKLTPEEHNKLLVKFGDTELAYWIETIDLEVEKQGAAVFNKRYKSHYATILSWKRLRTEKGQTVKPAVAAHRQNSKLAFEKEADTWKPSYANKRSNS